jgi:ABC-2 type transport system permease protein
MARLIKAEIYKLRKRSMTYILLAILLGFIALLLSIMQVGEASTSTTTTIVNGVATTQVVKAVAANIFFMKDAISVGITLSCGLVGLVLAVILISNATGSEYGWNTMRPYLLCSESRLKMATAKLIASAIFIVAGIIIGVVFAILLGALFTALRGYSWSLGSGLMSFTGHQLLNIVRGLYTILPYILLAFLFTVLGRSVAAGIGFGIGAYVAESIITGVLSMTHGWLAKIPNYLLSINVSKINSLAQSSGGVSINIGSSSTAPSALHAFIVLAVYCIVFTAVSFTVFQKRDVTG